MVESVYCSVVSLAPLPFSFLYRNKLGFSAILLTVARSPLSGWPDALGIAVSLR